MTPSGATPSSVRWSMMIGLAAFALVSYMARANISIAAETMMPALGITKVKMGQIFTSFLIGYAIFQIPGGALGDKLGPRRTLALSALVWGAATMLTGFGPALAGGSVAISFILLWVVRFFLASRRRQRFPSATV